MNEKKKLERFKKYCNETILDFKNGIRDEDGDYIIKQFQAMIDFEEVKPRIMPPAKGMALVFINQYLEKSLLGGSAVLTAEMIFGGGIDITGVAEIDKEHQFMNDYLNERYNFDMGGRMVTLNTGE